MGERRHGRNGSKQEIVRRTADGFVYACNDSSIVRKTDARPLVIFDGKDSTLPCVGEAGGFDKRGLVPQMPEGMCFMQKEVGLCPLGLGLTYADRIAREKMH